MIQRDICSINPVTLQNKALLLEVSGKLIAPTTMWYIQLVLNAIAYHLSSSNLS